MQEFVDANVRYTVDGPQEHLKNTYMHLVCKLEVHAPVLCRWNAECTNCCKFV